MYKFKSQDIRVLYLQLLSWIALSNIALLSLFVLVVNDYMARIASGAYILVWLIAFIRADNKVKAIDKQF